MVTPSQSGRASLNVRERWLVGVKELGMSPKRLTDRRMINKAKIGAAQGALFWPAARSITGGSWVVIVCQKKKIRVLSQLGV